MLNLFNEEEINAETAEICSGNSFKKRKFIDSQLDHKNDKTITMNRTLAKIKVKIDNLKFRNK